MLMPYNTLYTGMCWYETSIILLLLPWQRNTGTCLLQLYVILSDVFVQCYVHMFSGASLHTADQRYFWFHHSDGDTMSVQNPEEMNLCSAVWAVVAYVVADLEEMLPR